MDMKKLMSVAIVLLMSFGQLFAAHVDVNTAKNIGEKFVRNNMRSLRGVQNSKHVLTLSDDNGNACLYIFNIEDEGYYIISADDRAKPILAYSDEGCIDVNNIHPSMSYYLEHYKNTISYAIENNLKAEPEIEEEWRLVKTRSVVRERSLGKSVEPLVDLMWDQIYPYNYFCPTEQGGPGGHAFVGCAADVMAMIMKYWNYPEQGVGSHSYIPEGYPEQSADFGSTTYDWANMPKEITRNSPQKEIDAVATLMYHCGVSIDMKYGWLASSGYSELVPAAMKNYFKYTSEMRHLYRDQHELEEWEKLLMDNLDQGMPVYYAGSSQVSGGHAFLCDGYSEEGYFHFNWGWSGVSNGYFAIDALTPPDADYNTNQRAIFDFLPDYAHKCMPKAPSLEAETKTVYSKKSVMKIHVPTHSDMDETLEKIDKVVLIRNNKEVYSEENVTPGSVLTFEDEVDDYGIYDYYAYAVSNEVIGRWCSASLYYGPTCPWNIVASTTSYQGWNGASIKLMSGDKTFGEITASDSKPLDLSVQMPEGDVSFVWTAPKMKLSSISIKITDPAGEVVYEYSGSSSGINEGAIYSGNNTCENCKAPENLSAEFTSIDGVTGVLISWEKVAAPQSYKIYRSVDNENYVEIADVKSTENQYFDDNYINGVYYYQVTAYNEDCESMPAVTSDKESDYVVVEVVSVDENTISALIYPNPAVEQMNICLEGMTNISVYNMMGQKIIDEDVDADIYVMKADLLGQGVYMLKITSRKGVVTRKISISE